MTTIDAAAARRVKGRIALAGLALLVALGLGGCETANNLFGPSADATAPPAVGDAAAAAAVAQPARIAIAPIIGAPDSVAKQLQADVTSAIESKAITVAKIQGEAAEYTLRGYIVSAREKSGTKVSYIWDVTDGGGKRVHRITGEEVVPANQSKDPWASITPQVVSSIAGKTAAQLASWMPPAQSPAGIAAATPGTAAVSGAAVQTAAAPPAPVVTPQAAPAPAAPAEKSKPAAVGTTTGSIGDRTPASAMVPSVTGAPGDGSVTLTSALQNELRKNGVALSERPGGQTYRVEGKVVVGEGKNGKQPIQIDWHVVDPQGKKLGTVSQKNEIPQGSLDGAWGKTADAAAAAAAQGILKLLPPETRTN